MSMPYSLPLTQGVKQFNMDGVSVDCEMCTYPEKRGCSTECFLYAGGVQVFVSTHVLLQQTVLEIRHSALE